MKVGHLRFGAWGIILKKSRFFHIKTREFALFLNIYLRNGVHLLSLFKNNEQMFDYCSHFRYNEIILIAYY